MTYTYSKDFKNLVDKAYRFSKEFYDVEKPVFGNTYEPNPYYIGFGNPNSSILIIGKEKAIDSVKKKRNKPLFFESINNPFEWKNIISNSDTKINEKDVLDGCDYKDARWPYWADKPKGTWMNYQKIVEKVCPEIEKEKYNPFFQKAFITEVNHLPSKTSENKKGFEERLKFLKHPFYRNFPVIILACGDYLSRTKITKTFDLEFESDKHSIAHNKFITYRNNEQNRLLIHTRQLSNSLKNELVR